MTGIEISALPAAEAANDTDQLEVNQGGTSRRVTVGQLGGVIGVPTAPLVSASDDTAAAAAGVALYGFYQNAGVVRQRLV